MPTGDQSETVAPSSDHHGAWVMSINGWTSVSPAATQSELEAANAIAASSWAQLEETASEGAAPSYLVVDGKDFTAPLLRCLDNTGYLPSFPGMNPAEEMREKTQRAAAGVDWASCARDQGFLSISDPASPVADGYRTMPDVGIPDTLSEEQLRQLLESCPEVGAEQLARQRAADVATMTDAEYAELFLRVPSLAIESPCLDPAGSVCTSEQFEHIDALQDIVNNHEADLLGP
jgi:hypothetical protein